jgi:hypothetical protein
MPSPRELAPAMQASPLEIPRDRGAARDHALERAAVANLLVHLLAMGTMGLWLARFLPGGGVSDAERVARIAAQPWAFRAGWWPWHLCALINLAFAVALLRTPWVSRGAAWLAAGLACVAVIPDQGGQWWWITAGVELARRAHESGDLREYLSREAVAMRHLSGTAALFWTVSWWAAARAWSAGGVASRTSRALEGLAWPLMLLAGVSPWIPAPWRPPASVIAAINAGGFLAFSAWLALACELLLRRRRPDARSGRMAPWRHPSPAGWARGLDAVANSRLLGMLLELLPEFEMRSDIEQVVYVNHVVPAELLAPLVPEGLALDRLGPDGRWALFTHLTFRHGSFGWAFLGPLRARVAPSPVQSNWRIHVRDPRTNTAGIHFVTNAVDSTLAALGARMTTEAMPMHVLARAEFSSGPTGTRVTLDPGGGSAPDASLSLSDAPREPLEGAFAQCWSSWDDFLAYCVPQERAMDSQVLKGRVSRQEISLGIEPERCVPLHGEVRSRAAEVITRGAPSLCFRAPAARFRFLVEQFDPLPSRGDSHPVHTPRNALSADARR